MYHDSFFFIRIYLFVLNYNTCIFSFTQKMKNLLQDNIPYHDVAPRPAITRLRPFCPLDGDRDHFIVTTTADPGSLTITGPQ